MTKFGLEFILQSRNALGEALKNRLAEFGEKLELSGPEDGHDGIKDFRISIITEDPTVIFDICSQFGRIKAVKVDEISSPFQGPQ